MAVRTAPTRNRYVDFLRALSICVVVLGHWLVNMPVVIDGEWRAAELLRVAPWTQWLSWAFQVMPVFFVVGGYSNAASWRSAQRKGLDYGSWAAARLQRLAAPILPLLIFWACIAVTARQLDVEPALLRSVSRAALVPVWFLAVYILVTVATPLTHRLYREMGMTSFGLFALAAAAIDLLAFSGGLTALRWANYGFVWLAVHQLGFMWQDGRLAGLKRGLPLALGGLGLLLLVTAAGYPISMLTVPGATVSNSRPPTLALLAVGVFHIGLLLTLEAPAQRWLERIRPWILTVLVNSRIMTLYLWHLTVMVMLVGAAMQLGGIGLSTKLGSAAWWLMRPAWITVLLAVLPLFIALFGRYEQASGRTATALPTWRIITGSLLLSAGLASLARYGISDGGPLGLRLAAVLPAVAGALLVLLPRPSSRRGA